MYVQTVDTQPELPQFSHNVPAFKLLILQSSGTVILACMAVALIASGSFWFSDLLAMLAFVPASPAWINLGKLRRGKSGIITIITQRADDTVEVSWILQTDIQ